MKSLLADKNSVSPILSPLPLNHTSWFVPPRVERDELLDTGAGGLDDVRASLCDMWRISRYLGGVRALTDHLYTRLSGRSQAITVVDLGAGAARLDAVIARWAMRHCPNLHILALDLSARNLAVAWNYTSSWPQIRRMRADALRLPFKLGAVDYFISSLCLHHFSPEQVISFLRQVFSIARQGIILSDVMRGYLPVLAFKLGQPLLVRSYLTRYDGLVSIRRAYTPGELRALAEAAGLRHVQVHVHFPWWMTLVADK